MTRAELDNAIRILHSLDFLDVRMALSVTAPRGPDGLPNPVSLDARWIKFRDDPTSYFVTCDDDTNAALFALVVKRLKKTEARV
jgi:hypothetical protein